MKKGIKIILIITSSLFTVGLIMIIAGILSGGHFKNISLVTGKELEYVSIDKDYGNETIDSLDLDVTTSKVYIVEGDSFHIQGSKIVEDTVEVGVRENTLYIKEKDDLRSWIDKIGIYFDLEETVITVTVPKGFVAKQADFDIKAGTLKIESFATEQLDMEVNAGKVSIDRMTVNMGGAISLGAGSVKGDQIDAHNLEVEISAGSCNLEGAFYGALDLECSAGSLNLDTSLSDNEYSYDLERNAGSIQINGKSYKDYDNTNKSANNSIKVVVSAGSVNIDTK